MAEVTWKIQRKIKHNYVRPFLAEIGCRQIKTIRIIYALECSNSSLNSNDLKTLVSSC